MELSTGYTVRRQPASTAVFHEMVDWCEGQNMNFGTKAVVVDDGRWLQFDFDTVDEKMLFALRW